MAATQNPEEAATRPAGLLVRRLLLQLLVFFLLLAGSLFLAAGRLDWITGWAFLGAYMAFTAAVTLWLGRHDPGLLAERSNAERGDVRPIERLVFACVRVGAIGLYGIAGLDAGRFGWSSVPAPLRVLGWLMALAGGLTVLWVMRTNTFASAVVRVQTERGHQVIENGPYRFVRHPMYLGNLSLFLGMPLLFGSWWAYLPAALVVATFIFRTAQEDRYLREHLEGYADFATRTRFRLIPGLW